MSLATAGLALASLSTASADVAVLQNGYDIQYERQEVRGGVTRFYLTATPVSYIDVPTAEIAALEHEEAAPAAIPREAPVFGPPPPPSLEDLVSAASLHNYIDPDLINSVINAESGFNPNAISPKGAQGLMQLMPHTAAQLGVGNAMDPAANVEGGTRYLRELLARYNNDLVKALAAYNAGPQRVEQYHGVPPYPETHAYVARVIRDFNRKKLSERKTKSDTAESRTARQNSKELTRSQAVPSKAPSAAVPEYTHAHN